jgi:hypothetical protein
MKKAMLLVCVAAGMALAGTKTYDITLHEPATVGSTELKAGDYQLQLNGDKVTMKHGRDIVEANAKVETADGKNSSTTLSFDTAEGKRTIQKIRLGGTNMTVVLGSAAAGDSAGSR